MIEADNHVADALARFRNVPESDWMTLDVALNIVADRRGNVYEWDHDLMHAAEIIAKHLSDHIERAKSDQHGAGQKRLRIKGCRVRTRGDGLLAVTGPGELRNDAMEKAVAIGYRLLSSGPAPARGGFPELKSGAFQFVCFRTELKAPPNSCERCNGTGRMLIAVADTKIKCDQCQG